jgi:TusA-related sulfurtransferase
LQSGADNLATWASENRMAIHPDKTKVMLVGTKRKLATISEPLNISICGTTLSQSSSGKLLGIHMDDSLSWNEHISAVIKKFNTKLELVKRAKPYLTPELLLVLYNSLAKPTLEYCCSAWAG